MSQHGKIAPGLLPGLLRDLYLERRTGILEVSRDGQHGSICFVNGQIAWGESSIPECQLGPVLARHGIVSQEALDSVFDQVGGGKRLGSLLVEEGHLDATRLDEALTLHVRETLRTVFGWQDGFWRFEERAEEDLAGYAGALRISTGDLILDAVWSVTDPDVVRYQLGDLDRLLAPSTDPLLRFQRIALDPTDAFFLSRIDGTLTAREVLDLSPVGPEEGQRSLFGLLCTGLIELVAAAPPASPPPREPEPDLGPPVTPEEVATLYRDLTTRDHFALLGVAREASAAEVHAEFVRRARRFNPEAQRDPRVRALQKELETICARLAEAERMLSDAWRRAAYEHVLQRVHAKADAAPAAEAAAPARPKEDPEAAQARQDQLLAQADRLLEEGAPWDALQIVEGVLAEVGDERGRSRSRALFLRARVYMKNPKWRKDSERLLKELVAEEPGNAEAYFALGQLYKQEGIQGRATAMFQKVLALKPRHEAARAELGPPSQPASARPSWLRWPR